MKFYVKIISESCSEITFICPVWGQDWKKIFISFKDSKMDLEDSIYLKEDYFRYMFYCICNEILFLRIFIFIYFYWLFFKGNNKNIFI